MHDAPFCEPQRMEAVRSALLAWFAANARDLPWRKNYDPYSVWISEVMLQQTQMQRGIDYYNRWMERFPTLASVARASEEAILRAWEGLGYYSRARNVHAAARHLFFNCNGEFPESPVELRKLPGIGRYTACAIASIAFRQPVACVDANVERIVSRLFDIQLDVKSARGKRLIETLATSLLPAGKSREANQAMMEFGEIVCGKSPDCAACPLADFCLARAGGTVSERPVRKMPRRSMTKTVACALFCMKNALLVERREGGGIWSGLITLPETDVADGRDPADVLAAFFLERLGVRVKATGWRHCLRHAYTSWNITLWGVALLPEGPVSGTSPYFFLSRAELGSSPLPSPHRKLCDAYLAMS